MIYSALIDAIINGILIGGIFALFTLGLNMIYGVMEMINFAHGEFIMLGMYISYWFFVLYGLHPILSIFIIFPLLFLIGALFEKIAVERILKYHIFMQTFVTFGLLIFLQNFAYYVWKADYRAINIEFAPLMFGGLTISTPRLIGFLGSGIVIIILHLFLNRTKLGTAIRAVDDNPTAAQLMGVNVSRIRMITFGLGCGLAGIAGAFISLYFYVYPMVGWVFILLAFIIVVLGGMGSFIGTLVAGLIVGELYSISAFLIGPQWKEAIVMVAFIFILLVKPTGLFGKGGRK